LPQDNYINLIGVLIDQKVLEHLIHERLPEFHTYLTEVVPEVTMILSQKLFTWLTVLFVGELNEEAELYVWDMFFTVDSSEIFRVALTILSEMSQKIRLLGSNTMQAHQDVNTFGKKNITAQKLI
jgi:hypothetical protein